MPVRTRDEHGCDNEENDHRVLDGERIRDERTANIRGARMEAFGREQSRESEERPLIAFYRRVTLDFTKDQIEALKVFATSSSGGNPIFESLSKLFWEI